MLDAVRWSAIPHQQVTWPHRKEGMAAPERLILLPGLGGSPDLFAEQKRHFGDRLLLPRPPAAFPEESLAGYAARWARLLKADGAFDRPFVIGGISFGGQLALEMARWGPVRPEAVVLIAANRTSASIHSEFRQRARLGRLLPSWAVKAGLKVALRWFISRERLSREHADLLRRMASQARVDLLLWGAKAACDWQFTEEDVASLGVPVFQIHGEDDWVIPLFPAHPDLVVAGAGHLLPFTHARTVNEYLEQKLRSRGATTLRPEHSESGSSAARR
jgi:pimeloyl-ACP methyl ester carboxylesterase